MREVSIFLVALAIGIAGTYFFMRPPLPPPATSNNYDYISARDAHHDIVNYRRSSGICNLPDPWSHHEGIFELEDSIVRDIPLAINNIKDSLTRLQTPTNEMPNRFRFFLGYDDATSDSATLMIVGLNPLNGEEFFNQVRTLGGKLLCPKMCELQKSNLFLGPNFLPDGSCSE